MTALQLIAKLGAQGIKIWLDDQQQLRFKAKPGAMTSSIKTEIKALKTEIIALLKKNQTASIPLTALPRVEESEFELSFSQQRFWYLDQIEPGNPALHIPVALRIEGVLSLQGLSTALNQLIIRHESLRTYFTLDQHNQVKQKISRPFNINLGIDYDLSHLSQPKRESTLQQILQEEAAHPFTLIQNSNQPKPLFRIKIAKLGKTEKPCSALIINLHHIIADGWSMKLLIQELSLFYQHALGKNSALPQKLPLQYIDYAIWQNTAFQHDAYKIDLDYWVQSLTNTPDLKLTYQARNLDNAFAGDSLQVAVPETASRSILALSQKHQITPLVSLMTALRILLFRYTEQTDFAVGTPTTGRTDSQTSAILGCFINLLALRLSIDPNENFIDLCQRQQQQLLAAQEHQSVPFEAVVEALALPNQIATHPIFQVLFTLQTALVEGTMLGDETQTSLIPFRSVAAKYDLQLHIDQNEDQLTATFEFNTGVFHSKMIAQLAQHYLRLLETISQTPDTPVAALTYLAAEDYFPFLPHQEAGFTAKRTLIEQFEKTALKKPHHIAVSQGTDSITHAELHQKADHLAAIMLNQCESLSSGVAICLPAGINAMVAILAVIKTGAAYIPLDSNYPKARLDTILDAANPDLVISQPSLITTHPQYRLIDIEKINLTQPMSLIAPEIALSQSFYTIFTSGSTGKPKGVTVNQSNVYNLLHWYQSEYQFNEQDVFLVISALGFDLTQKNLLLPLLIGAEIVFVEQLTYDPEAIVDTLYEKSVTVMNCVPSAFYPIIDHCKHLQQFYRLSSLQHLLLGGEPIRLERLSPWWPDCQTQITNMYGPTECTDIATVWDIDKNHPIGLPIPIGQPIAGVSTFILDSHQNPVPIGMTGELYIGGLGVSAGYANLPEMNAKKFIANPFQERENETLYRTDDRVYAQYVSGNNLAIFFLDRLDEQIKIRGFRVDPKDIQLRIEAFNGVFEALVIKPKQSDSLIAYYISEDGHEVDLLALRYYLQAHLPDYMIPQAFVDILQWPLSANGKVDRTALPEPNAQHVVHKTFIAPTNAIQKQLASLFAEQLGIDHIGIQDHFFELGGHSILATQLVAKIQHTFGIDLPVRDFFEQPTVEGIALYVEQHSNIDHLLHQFPLEAKIRPEFIPLTQGQKRIWVIEQIQNLGATYHIPFTVKLDNTVNLLALEKAVEALLNRHESLRTGISNNTAGGAYQWIRKTSEFTPLRVNLSCEDALQTELNSVLSTPFDFETETLCRIKILQTDNKALLAICLHHLIGDAWSLGVLQQDLFALYASFAHDKAPTLKPLTVQYADFALWQQDYLDDKKVAKHKDFWVQTLTDAPDYIKFPYDFTRPKVQSFNGALAEIKLGDKLLEKLNRFAQSQGLTPYSIWLSSYFLLLQQYSKDKDICIGTTVSGREQVACQSLIGYFINTLVIRHQLNNKIDFTTLCQQVLDRVLAAMAHQDIPIESILAALPLKRSLAYNPIAQVGFNLIAGPLVDLNELNNTGFQLEDSSIVQAKYDFLLTVIESSQTLSLEYNTTLLSEASAQTLLSHYINILDLCLDYADEQLYCLDFVDHKQLIQHHGLAADTITEIMPLNAMQNDMVLAQAHSPSSRANTLGYRIDLPFKVEPALWQQALIELAHHHPRLRSTLITNTFPVGHWAYQATLKETAIPFVTLKHDDLDLPDSQIESIIDDFIYQPSAYEKQIYFRYARLSLKNTDTMLFSCHHALLDGISVAIIAEQVTQLYQQKITGIHSVFKVSDFDYKHYIQSNRLEVDSPNVITFWQDKLAPCEPLHHVNTQNTAVFSQHTIETYPIDAVQWQAIKQFCKQQRTTPAIYFKMLYSFLIYQYCDVSADFYFTEFHAKRDQSNQHTLGCFFQQSPFIVPEKMISQNNVGAFLAYAKQFQKQTRHVNALSKGQTQALSPQGNIEFMFNYYHFLPEYFDILDQQAPCEETPPFVEGAVQFIIKGFNQHSELCLYYQPHLFNSNQFLTRLMAVNEQILKQTTDFNSISLLNHKEYMQHRFEWQPVINPHHRKESDLVSRLNLICDQQGEKIALIEPGATLNFADLASRSNQLAHYLKNQGVGPESKVAVVLPNCIDAIVAILGVIKAGGAYIPLDFRMPTERLQGILQQAGVAHILSAKAYTGKIPNHSHVTLLDDQTNSALNTAPTNTPALTQSLDDLLYIIFTSGSTGQPKGSMITHANELNLLDWYSQQAQITQDARFLLLSTLSFDLSQKNIFAPLLAGGQLLLPNQTQMDLSALFNLIQQYPITHLNTAPSVFYPLIADPSHWPDVNSLAYLILGGEDIQLKRLTPFLLQNQTQLVNHYGPTECTDIAAFYEVPKKTLLQDTPIPIGRPNDNVNVFILNQQRQLMPQGVVGEIAIAGTGVSRGYLDNTHDRFIPNPLGEGRLYLTGDSGYWNAAGQLVFLGRRDFQFKIAGQRIDSTEIENILMRYEDITAAAVIKQKEKIIAYIETPQAHKLNDDPTLLANQLPSYMIPNIIISIPSMPLNANGKIDRKQLQHIEPKVKPQVAPRNAIEQTIADILCAILNLESISVEEDLFTLGANSLTASQALLKIRSHFAVDLPTQLLFELTTIEKLAAFIKASQWQQQPMNKEKNIKREIGSL